MMKHWFRACRAALLLALLALASPVWIHAQDTAPDLAITDIDTSAYPQVRATLVSRRGAPLDPAKLSVNEDDRAVKINAAAIPGIAVAVLIDTSRSMRGRGLPDPAQPDLFVSRIATARRAAATLAQALAGNVDLMGVYTFDRQIQPLPLVGPDGACSEAQQHIRPVDGNNIADSLTRCLPEIAPEARRRTDAAILADQHSYSAVSDAIVRATDELSATLAADPKRRTWQRAVVLMSDSCDNTNDQNITPQDCTPKPDVTSLLTAQPNSLSLFSVALGGTNEPRERPPQKDDATLYAARPELLDAYAKLSPHGAFLPLTADGKTWNDFDQQVVKPILARSQQVVVTFDSQPTNWVQTGGRRTLKITDGPASVAAQFNERPLPPVFELTDDGKGAITPSFTIQQGTVKHVTYYVAGGPPILSEKDPFALSYDTLAGRTGPITATAFLEVGGKEISGASAKPIPIPASVPRTTPASTRTPTEPPIVDPPSWLQRNLPWIILLLTAIALAVAAVFLLWRRRPAPAPASQPRTGAIRQTLDMFAANAQEADKSVLKVLVGADAGKQFSLTGRTQYIGASTDLADIVIDDAFVSGRHASLQRDGDTLNVIDLDSKNHTFVNQLMLKPHDSAPLKPGDLLTVGKTTLQWLPQAETLPAHISQPAGSRRPTEEIVVPRQERQP